MNKNELVLEALSKYLKANPNLRLGQVIANMTYKLRGDFDPFYLENEDLIDILNKTLKQEKIDATRKILKNVTNKMR